MRIVTGCLCPTRADNLPTLAGIQPLSFVAMEPHMSLARRSMEPGHMLHSALTRPSSANVRRLKSRQAIVPAAQHLISLSDNSNIGAAHWADYQWNAEWTDSATILRIISPTPAPTPLESPSQEELGSGLTASALVSNVSAPALQMEYGLLCGL